MSTPRPAAVIVLAAGEGTRMKSATPKVLHRIGGTPLLGHAVRAAREAGAGRVGVVVRHQREVVVEYLRTLPAGTGTGGETSGGALVVADQDDVKGTGR
ncbi:MAG: NTP transferase domain-containing protein, partial [Phycicoccus sp.]